MVKILITGASGLLGRACFLAFKKDPTYEVFGTSFSRKGDGLLQIDLRDYSALDKLIADLRPDVVLHCAAERRPDVCEKAPEAVQELNISLPSHLSDLSLSPSAPFALIYISTDYVFPGNAPVGGYQPADLVAPTNLYGVTKEAGERVVVAGFEKGGKGCILRVPVLYGPVETNSESAINCLLDVVLSSAQGKPAKMDNWAIRYPTNVTDVARVLHSLSNKALLSPLPHILHFSTQEPFTKYEICQFLASLSRPPIILDHTFIAVNDGPKAGETVRPKDCHLSNDVIESLGIDTSASETFAEWWTRFLA